MTHDDRDVLAGAEAVAQEIVEALGALFFATRKGVLALGVPLIGCTTPAPTWWAHDVACAWTGAWMTVRGRRARPGRRRRGGRVIEPEPRS